MLALLTHGARKLFAGSVLSDDLEGLDWWRGGCGGREAREGGLYVYTQLTHVVLQQKPAQRWKAIVLQGTMKTSGRGGALMCTGDV